MWFKKKVKQVRKQPGMLVFTIPSSESLGRDFLSRIDLTTGAERKSDISFKTLMTGRKQPIGENEVLDD